jgi:hypothetical protein
MRLYFSFFDYFALLANGDGAVMHVLALVGQACHVCFAMSVLSLRACLCQLCACTFLAAHQIALCLVHVAC